jgi:CRP-like cAMP-binding protein
MHHALLKKVPIFSQLDNTELERIRKLLVPAKYEKDRLILIEQDSGNSMFLLQKGRVKVSQMTDDGREVILSILEDGAFFGEMSLLDGKARSASVTAIEHSEVLILRRGDFLNLLEQYPKIAINLLKELAGRLRRSDTQIKSLSLQDAMGRVASAIIRIAEDHGRIRQNEVIIPRIPLQQDLANMAGTSRETISRVFKYLEEENLIKREGRKLTITNFPRFKRIYL